MQFSISSGSGTVHPSRAPDSLYHTPLPFVFFFFIYAVVYQ